MRVSPLYTPQPDNNDAAPRLVADENGTLLHINPAFERLCGIQQKDGRLSLVDLLHFENPEEAFHSPPISGQPIFLKLRSGPHDVYFDHSGMTASLHFDWIDIPGRARVLVASADAVPPTVDAVNRWLHQKPVRQGAVAFSENIFQSLSRDCMIVLDDLGTLIELNAPFQQLFGADVAHGPFFLDLIHPEQRSEVRTLLGGLTHSSNSQDMLQFDARMLGVGGQNIYIEWTCRSLNGYCYALGRDITFLKRTKHDLAQQKEQLREAEAIGRIGHWYWKLGQDDIAFSDELYSIFGVSREQFSPTLDLVNQFVHRRDIGRMMRAFQRAIIEQNDHDVDFRIKRLDGEIIHLRCRGRCKLDREGDVIALFGIMQDISDRIAHETDLRQAKEEAEHAYATKSQFLANMSHELRTPLNAIIGFSEILERQLFGPIGNEKYIGYTKGIRESGEHLLDLITDILDMSKIEAGQYKLSIEKFSIDKILHTAIHMMEGRALDKRIRINLSIDKNPREMIADKRAIMQVILNILSNAVKFSHPGGHVQIQYMERKEHLSLRISDEGIGIPANKIPYITRPFEQVSNQYNRSHEGSGLGLAISKELIELHGGSLHIDSTLGKGTSVIIKLPYHTAKE